MSMVLDSDTTTRDHVTQANAEHVHVVVQDDPLAWRLTASDAREGLRLRHAFRDYLEAYGDPVSDFDAAEAVYGELVGNCVRHAPGSLRVEFRWCDRTLAVVDECDRLRDWPFSKDDHAAETTHRCYAIVRAMGGRLHVTREGTGTRATVELPVVRDEV